MIISVLVDGASRLRIEWNEPVEGVMPDDIRLARLLKGDSALWAELIDKRLASASFDGKIYSILTRKGAASAALNLPGSGLSRILEPDHPFLELVDRS